MDIFLILLTILGIVTAVIMATITYFSKTNFIFKMISLPFIFIFMFSIAFYIKQELGRPVLSTPTKIELIHFEIMDSGESIVFWSNDKDGPRLYKIPYNRDVAKKMQEAMDKKEEQQGIKIEGVLKSDEKNGFEQTFEYETTFKDTTTNYTK